MSKQNLIKWELFHLLQFTETIKLRIDFCIPFRIFLRSCFGNRINKWLFRENRKLHISTIQNTKLEKASKNCLETFLALEVRLKALVESFLPWDYSEFLNYFLAFLEFSLKLQLEESKNRFKLSNLVSNWFPALQFNQEMARSLTNAKLANTSPQACKLAKLAKFDSLFNQWKSNPEKGNNHRGNNQSWPFSSLSFRCFIHLTSRQLASWPLLQQPTSLWSKLKHNWTRKEVNHLPPPTNSPKTTGHPPQTTPNNKKN